MRLLFLVPADVLFIIFRPQKYGHSPLNTAVFKNQARIFHKIHRCSRNF